MMTQDSSYIMGFGIWILLCILILAFLLFLFGIYAWNIYQFRTKNGFKLDHLRNQYLESQITKGELIEFMKELQ